MPELPEVETTCRGIKDQLLNQRLTSAIVRCTKLRWPVPTAQLKQLMGEQILKVTRRAKYILIQFESNTLIVHLGMSGRLYLVDQDNASQKHDHVDLHLSNGLCLRFTDPRRFGCMLLSRNPENHPLLKNLGPEPLTTGFDGDYLKKRAKDRKIKVKQFLMQGQVVVGVGNIYASESLFRAGINPTRTANQVSLARYRLLAKAVKNVLTDAISAGGTTLKDFVNGDGKPGYFQQDLKVYGRTGHACYQCKQPIRTQIIAQRNTFYCGSCQR